MPVKGIKRIAASLPIASFPLPVYDFIVTDSGLPDALDRFQLRTDTERHVTCPQIRPQPD